VLDVLGKAIHNDILMSGYATLPFLTIIEKFQNESSLKEYVRKFVLLSLGVLQNYEKQKYEIEIRNKRLGKKKPNISNNSPSPTHN
jgi:hypothetical protein